MIMGKGSRSCDLYFTVDDVMFTNLLILNYFILTSNKDNALLDTKTVLNEFPFIFLFSCFTRLLFHFGVPNDYLYKKNLNGERTLNNSWVCSERLVSERFNTFWTVSVNVSHKTLNGEHMESERWTQKGKIERFRNCNNIHYYRKA